MDLTRFLLVPELRARAVLGHADALLLALSKNNFENEGVLQGILLPICALLRVLTATQDLIQAFILVAMSKTLLAATAIWAYEEASASPITPITASLPADPAAQVDLLAYLYRYHRNYA